MSLRHAPGPRGLLAAAGAVCLLLAPAAAATSSGWNETAKSGGTSIMTYTVDSFTFGSKGWQAHVTFRNLSKATITVGRGFGVAFFGDAHTEDTARAVGFAIASTFSTKLPKSLRPGASWTGVIGGTGSLTRSQKVWARVVFGPFTGLPGIGTSMVWITDHAKVLSGPLSLAPVVTGPVI